MNYERIYQQLICRARQRVAPKEKEVHHIIPRCMGGTDEPANLVALTPEEHYVAHALLVKMYPSEAKLIFALSRMSSSTRKMYGWARRLHSETQSKAKIGLKRPPGFQMGRVVSEETRKKLSDRAKKQIRKPVSEETRQKLRISLAKRRHSAETKLKMSLAAKERERRKRAS